MPKGTAKGVLFSGQLLPQEYFSSRTDKDSVLPEGRCVGRNGGNCLGFFVYLFCAISAS